MLGLFRKLLPREDAFFELFASHSERIVGAAQALERLLAGEDVEGNAATIVKLEDEADAITREVLLAVRRSFITPFDRGDIKDLIQSMDDAIDMMNKVVKSVRLFDQTSFDPGMQEMGKTVVEAANIVAAAIPLLDKINTNAARLSAMAEEVGAKNSTECIADGTFKKFGAAQASQNDIKGTPTVEVNGKRLDLQAGELSEMEALLN